MRPLALLVCAVGCASSAPVQPQFAPASSADPRAPADEKRAGLAGHTVLVRDLDGLALFPDEQLVAQKAIAQWVETQNARVVDVGRAHALFTRASLGQDVETGAPCGLALSDWDAEPRYWAALGATAKLRASVGCESADEAKKRAANAAPRCALTVYANDGAGWDGHDIGSWTAPWERDVPWQTALAHALPALALADDDTGGLGGLFGSLADGVVEAQPEQFSWGATPASSLADKPWDTIPDALPLDAARAKELRACVLDSTYGVELLVETAANGAVSRCVSRNAQSAEAQCACRVLTSGAHASKAASATRLHIGVSYRAADVVTPNKAVASAYANTHVAQTKDAHLFMTDVSDPSISEWRAPNDHALAQCFAKTTELARLRVGATITFDARGNAKDVAFSAKSSPLGDERTACVKRALLQSRAACPARDGLTARVEVQAQFLVIGQPRPGLGDLVGNDAP